MRGTFTLSMLALSMALGGTLYRVSYDTQSLERERTRIERRLAEIDETRHLLAAEWSYLNSPARIEALARKHLGFQPLPGERIVDFARLPYSRPSDPLVVAESARPKPKPSMQPQRSLAAASMPAPSDDEGRSASPSSLTTALAAVIGELTR